MNVKINKKWTFFRKSIVINSLGVGLSQNLIITQIAQMDSTNFHKSVGGYKLISNKKSCTNVQLFYIYVQLIITVLLPE